MKIVCPTCQRQLDDVPADFEPRPFCSIRCKHVDLSHWLAEKYRVSEPLDQQLSEVESDP
jgi:endogenous inhibitor of DNA gyrase (YacG/DUF329 family)